MNSIKLKGTNNTNPTRTDRSAEADYFSKQKPATKPGAAQMPPESDAINVSDLAATTGGLIERLARLSVVRQDRVDSLRGLVESGSYHPPARDIADAIIRYESNC